MDTTLRIDLEYSITDWLTLAAYVAYCDYWFDGNMRKAAAAYNGEWAPDTIEPGTSSAAFRSATRSDITKMVWHPSTPFK